MNRRDILKTLGLGALGLIAQGPAAIAQTTKVAPQKSSQFKYCLNTSTIRGQKPGLKKSIEIAVQAGYDSLELWVGDVKDYKSQGNSLSTLKRYMDDSKITVEDAIGFAPWMVDDDQQRAAGFTQMKEEMQLMLELGCKRI